MAHLVKSWISILETHLHFTRMAFLERVAIVNTGVISGTICIEGS